MKDDLTQLVDDPGAIVKVVRAFCERYGVAESTFGRLAVNDGKLVPRISSGSRIEPETARRVAEFMARADRGEIRLRGRPRRKKTESSDYRMAELVNQETSIHTPGSFAQHEQRHRYHVFAATTNESWVKADIITSDVGALEPGTDGFRLFFSPMDNGITLVRALRALHALHPDVPVQVVIKGWGLEDLRNTMSRMVDRLAEHPRTAFVMTNLYTREAVHLDKTAEDGPGGLSWHDVAFAGTRAFDYQRQMGGLFKELAPEWYVIPGEDDLPVYARPSVVCFYREDQRDAIRHLIPAKGGSDLAFDYAFLNHPYLHSHTMTFRTEYVLKPVIGCLAPGGQMKVVQSLGDDPAHEIVRTVWPDRDVGCVSRHDIISALKRSLGDAQRAYSFTGLTDAKSLFRFDMHTLPMISEANSGTLSLSLQSAWNNTVFFSQVREDLAQAAMREDTRYLDATAAVLRKYGGLWFVNEAFSATRRQEA